MSDFIAVVVVVYRTCIIFQNVKVFTATAKLSNNAFIFPCLRTSCFPLIENEQIFIYLHKHCTWVPYLTEVSPPLNFWCECVGG